MNFTDLIENKLFVLSEGSVIERVKREFNFPDLSRN